MSKQLIIEKKHDQVAIAFLEDRRLIEYHTERERGFRAGDFYLGKVKKILPGMNAAFVDVGHEKDGFLHYTDLSPYIHTILRFTRQLSRQDTLSGNFSKFKIEEETLKKGKIEEVLGNKPTLLVQILKEPISTKGPRLTCEFVLTGRHLILRPFASHISISKKVNDPSEKKRLEQIVRRIKQNNFGMIVRTAAMGKSEQDIIADHDALLRQWTAIQENLLQAQAPRQIHQEASKTITMVRDMLNEDFTTIAVNNNAIGASLKGYLETISPEKTKILQTFAEGHAIMSRFGITRQLSVLFGKNVGLPSGAYLFIEKTEALHVIDVNSGNRVLASTQEENALQTNIEAAQEIARQLRLRDLGGIIIIDFIDMKLPDNKKKVYETMHKLMKTDKAKHSILPLSKFNIMQITRQRMRPEVNVDTHEVCFVCEGTGKATPIINIEEELLRSLHYVIEKHKDFRFVIKVHPFLRAYFTKGRLASKRLRMSLRFRRWIHFEADTEMGMNSFSITDVKGERLV